MKKFFVFVSALCMSLSIYAGDLSNSTSSEIPVVGRKINVSVMNKQRLPLLIANNQLITRSSLSGEIYASSLTSDKWSGGILVIPAKSNSPAVEPKFVAKGVDKSLLILDAVDVRSRLQSLTVIKNANSVSDIKSASNWKQYDLSKITPVRFENWHNFVSLSDSTILLATTPWNDVHHLFSIIDYKNASIQPLDYLPEDGLKCNDTTRVSVYSMESGVYNNHHGRFLYRAGYARLAFIFTIEDNKIKVIKELYSDYPDYIDNKSTGCFLFRKTGRVFPLESAVNDNRIYVLNKDFDKKGNRIVGVEGVSYGNIIEEFDWDGNMIRRLRLDEFGQDIMLSEDGKTLYLFSNDYSSAGKLSQKVTAYDI